MRIGIVAVQGAFEEHRQMLHKLGEEAFFIRRKEDLVPHCDGLILPGGESTVMEKLIKDLKLFKPIQALIQKGTPVFGTCAGLILLAEHIENDARQCFGTMNIYVRRNAYGRQLGSFNTQARFNDSEVFPMTFIRAPQILSIGENVHSLASVDGQVVAARQRNQLITAFHPELTENLMVHQYFLDMIQGK